MKLKMSAWPLPASGLILATPKLFEMNERMKILIPYDGSTNVEVALRALRHRADYSQVAHDALVVISEVWLADSAGEFSRISKARHRKASMAGGMSHSPALRASEEERVLSQEARDRMTSMFPLWNIEVETLPGFSLVSSEIVQKANRSNMDVIVIGIGNPFANGPNAYGAGALRVASEAGCNVFLASDNGRLASRRDLPSRIALVLNGSGDNRIVQTAVRRRWPTGTHARIIVNGLARSSVSTAHAEEKLNAAGINVSVSKPHDRFISTLMQTVIDWKPDTIFTYAGFDCRDAVRKPDRDTSTTLLNAGCSIELVRKSSEGSNATRATA